MAFEPMAFGSAAWRRGPLALHALVSETGIESGRPGQAGPLRSSNLAWRILPELPSREREVRDSSTNAADLLGSNPPSSRAVSFSLGRELGLVDTAVAVLEY